MISRCYSDVAPLAGAWIEIVHLYRWSSDHPVAPLAGAWIEITEEHTIFHHGPGRSPRGSVD